MNKLMYTAGYGGTTCSCGCVDGTCQCAPECPCGCNTWEVQNLGLRNTCSCEHDVLTCPCPPFCRCGCNRWPAKLSARCACGCRFGECQCAPQCPCGCNSLRGSVRRHQYMRAQCTLSQTGTYSDTATCSASTPCGWKYKCNPDLSCTLAADGAYGTQTDCYGTAGKCGWKYKCVNGACTQAQDGTFATAAECQESTDPVLGFCGWKWMCGLVTSADEAADPTNKSYKYQGIRTKPTVDNSAALQASGKATKEELTCVSASLATGGPTCKCQYNTGVVGKYNTVDACMEDSTAKCGWQYGAASVTALPSTKLKLSDSGVYYIDTATKTKKGYPSMAVLTSWWPSGSYGETSEYESYASGSAMATRQATDPLVADYDFDRQTMFIKPSSNVPDKYQTFNNMTWYGSGDYVPATSTVAASGSGLLDSSMYISTVDDCARWMNSISGATGATWIEYGTVQSQMDSLGQYNAVTKRCDIFKGTGVLQPSKLASTTKQTAIVKAGTVGLPSNALNTVRPSAPPGVDCVCQSSTLPSTSTSDKYFSSLTECKLDAASQCGWTVQCPPNNTMTVPSGGMTVYRGLSTGYYGTTTGKEYLLPISIPFVACKEFIQVRGLDTGTIRVPSVNTTGVTASGSDNCAARYEVRGFGNVTANQPDPDNSYPVIIWGDESAYGGRSSTAKIPGFPWGHSNGNGRAVVNKTYRLYMRIWDQTDDDMIVTWPSFTITMTDNAGFTMTTVPGSPRGSYPSTITSSDTTPCLNYYYNQTTAPLYAVAFDPELGVMYSPSGTFKLYKNSAGQLTLQKIATGATNALPSPFTTALNTIALCMTTAGELAQYNINYDDVGTLVSAPGAGGPYKLSLSDAGVLSIVDKANTVTWSYTFV